MIILFRSHRFSSLTFIRVAYPIEVHSRDCSYYVMQSTCAICLDNKTLELRFDLDSWIIYFVLFKSLNTKGKIKV